MSGTLESYNIELFRLDPKQLFDIGHQLSLRKYSLYMQRSVAALFKDEVSCLWHITELLRAKKLISTVAEFGAKGYLVTLEDQGLPYLAPYFMKNPDYQISLSDEGNFSLDLPTETGFTIFRRLIRSKLNISARPPVSVSGFDIVDRSSKIIEPPNGDTPVLRFLKHCSVYRGASLRFRKYGNSFFLQIIPQARIELDAELDRLISDNVVNKDDLPRFVPYVTLPNGRSARLLKVLHAKASDKIADDEIFEGRSFIEFAVENHPDQPLRNPDSLMVGVGTESGPALFSLESLKANVTFSTLSSISEDFFSKLIKILKLESAQRLDRAIEWMRRITPIEIGGAKLQISANPAEQQALRQFFETDLSNLDPVVPGGTFKSPPISLMMKVSPNRYEEREIPSGYLRKYDGTVNDLLKNSELKPLDVPQKPKVIVFVKRDLTTGWNALKRSLENGTGQPAGYRGFLETFGSDPIFKIRLVDDFFSNEFDMIIQRLKEKQYSCAVVVIPRFLKTPDETRRIYTETKVKIMNKGIPVQVITDDPRVTENRNNTLMGKSMNSRICFGIALNIFVKMGSIIAALAPSLADKLLPKSVVIGYNVIRVPPKSDQTKLLHSPRRTIPLAAPLVIFDNRGSKITHQWIYRLENETSLFEGASGKDILSQIPHDIENVVIHKDGPFFPNELAALRRLFEGKKKVFPMSIIRSEVPRIFKPKHKGAGFELYSGTFLALDRNEYVMTTTPIASWKPDRLGWPCPILVRFHGTDLENDQELQRKLLFQVYALTKMQTGSQRATRLPISIHYSNMIGRFIRKVGDPTPEYLRLFVRRLPDQKFIPKWYP